MWVGICARTFVLRGTGFYGGGAGSGGGEREIEKMEQMIAHGKSDTEVIYGPSAAVTGH